MSLALLCGLGLGPLHAVGAADMHLADAIELALAKNPDIAVQRAQTQSLRGLELQARSQFDFTLAANTSASRTVTPIDVGNISAPVWEQTRQTATGYQAGGSKQLRNGVIVGTSLVAAAARDTTPGAFPGQQNAVTLNVSLTVPLWRGRGTENVTGPEQAAGLNALASEYAVRDRVAQTVHDVAVAYWTFRSRVELERIALDAEQRSASLVASTHTLVDKAEKPRSDLVLVNADHADKVIARKAAELNRLDARNALGRIVGIDAAAISALSVAADAIPGPQAVPVISSRQISVLGETALQRRPDLSALNLQIDAAARLVKVARNNLKPQVDLQVGASYGKVSEGGSRFGFLTVPGRTQAGPSVSAALNFQFPVENNNAKGVLLQSTAAVDQLTVQRRDLQIAVVNSVEAAVAAVLSSAERSQIARAGLAAYRQAIEHEVTKQRNGISTLIDVINIESKYVDARVNYLQLELEYAVAVANLRLATGTLLPDVAPGSSALDRMTVDVGDLQSLGRLNL